MWTLRLLYLAVITGLCLALIADGGILYLLLPFVGWGVMEAAAVFHKPGHGGTDPI